MPQDSKTFPGSTPDSPPIALARIGKVTGSGDQVNDADWVDVHFNPASLQLQLSNELKDQPNQERKQYIAKTSAKLSLELQFDTTDSGTDVTQTTRRIQAFIAPPLPGTERARQQLPPPLAMFEWGTLRFKGIVETYRETIDFFSADGVPLRASVNLTLTRQDQVFDPAANNDPADVGRSDESGLFDAPPASPSKVAGDGGNPNATRAIAAANGQENLRFGNGASLTVGGGVNLKAAAGFNVGGGLSIGVGGGIGVGVSAGAGAGLSAGAGVAGLAGLSATEGAFASLRTTGTGATGARLDSRKLLPATRTAGLTTGAGAQFQVGGQAAGGASAGLRTNVGVGARLSFDED